MGVLKENGLGNIKKELKIKGLTCTIGELAR